MTTQAEVMAILDELRRERGLALLFITHDLELAAAVCDRTAVMYAGQIVETTRRRPLHARPAAPLHAPRSLPPGPTSPPRRTAWRRSPAARSRRSRRRRAAVSLRAAPIAQDACRAARQQLEPLDGGAGALRARRASCAAPVEAAMPEPVGGQPMPTILEARGLRKEFGDLVAVDDVTFD